MVEQALLGLLSKRPMHGYELFQAFSQAGLQEVCSINNVAQLYPFLRRMRELGWVAEKLEPQQGRPDRKVFHVTPAGRGEFDEWLGRPVERRREIRDEFLTKLAFAAQLDRRRTLDLLDQQIAIYQSYQATLERNRDLIPPDQPMARLAVEAGIRHSQTDIDWAKWCQTQIEQEQKGRKQ